MMKKTIVSLGLLIVVQNVFAQSAADSIKAVINQFFVGMKNADTSAVRETISANLVLQTVARTKEGTVVEDETVAQFFTAVASLKPGAADERITFQDIKIDANMASVWTPYQFYFDGKFSHCGVNSFQLVRFNSGWKIQYIIDTRRRQGCE